MHKSALRPVATSCSPLGLQAPHPHPRSQEDSQRRWEGAEACSWRRGGWPPLLCGLPKSQQVRRAGRGPSTSMVLAPSDKPPGLGTHPWPEEHGHPALQGLRGSRCHLGPGPCWGHEPPCALCSLASATGALQGGHRGNRGVTDPHPKALRGRGFTSSFDVPGERGNDVSLTFFGFNYLLFFKRFLFIHERPRERGRDTGRGRRRLHAGSPTWDSILGLRSHTLDQRQALNH